MIYEAYRRILLYRLVFGTPSLRVDLVDANLKFAPTIKSRGIGQLWPFFSFPHPFKGGSFAQVKIIGPLLAFDYITRNSEARSTSSSFTFVINVDRIRNAGPTSWKWVQPRRIQETYVREWDHDTEWLVSGLDQST